MSRVVLAPLTAIACETVRSWRNDPRVRSGLRTADLLTDEQQGQFYARVVCDPHSAHRFWAVMNDFERIVGMAGLTDMRFPDGLAEVSLLIEPECWGRGYGTEAVALVLAEAFDCFRLLTVFGECYESNPPALRFWRHVTKRYSAESTTLPRRKWWDGRLWDSWYFSISVEAWRLLNEEP